MVLTWFEDKESWVGMSETKPMAAAGAMLLAMAIIGLIDNFVVIIAETHGLWQFQIARMVMAVPVIFVVGALGFGALNAKSWPAVVTRSAFVAMGLLIYFGGLAFMPIEQVAAGIFTSPIWVLLISVVVFRRKIGLVRASAILTGFLGVVIVLSPDAGEVTALSFVPITAGIFYAIGSILTREWCSDENSLPLLAMNFVAFAAFSAVALVFLAFLNPEVQAGAEGFLVRGWAPMDANFLKWVALQAVGSLVGVWFLIRSYQMAETSFISMFEFSFLMFASFWAWVLFGSVPEPWTLLGIALIIAAGIVIALRDDTQ